MSNNGWDRRHVDYQHKDWINKPSIFAEQAIEYFPKSGRILELGAGLGQDSRFFAGQGYSVVSTDNGEVAVSENLKRSAKFDIQVEKLDLKDNFPYPDESFDVVYAHLSLHYFSEQKTHEIFDDIHRVLKPGGIFAFFTNSTDDPEFNTGEKLEEYYFVIGDLKKRYLNPEEAEKFAAKFETILCDNQGETYKDSAKGIHNLIRYVGRKKS
ncbi:MAG: class I SAM-dependent methyltransferase [Candidatus Saccharimonadales bacterium]|nr:class I SAM-dependent methyltransferase [Candidatus Saccharimonadales bacterium]